MYIRNRNDLIKWLESNAPFPAITRALQEGQVENLGAFEGVAPGSRPGWIVKVTSVYNKVWYIAIIIKSFHLYKALVLDSIHWKLWAGDTSNNKLYQGDNSKEYKRLRDEKQATPDS